MMQVLKSPKKDSVYSLMDEMFECTQAANNAMAVRDMAYFHSLTSNIQKNPFYNSLYGVLFDMKHAYYDINNIIPTFSDPIQTTEQERQLDKMLANENIISVSSHQHPTEPQKRELPQDEEHSRQLKRLRDVCSEFVSRSEGIAYEMNVQIRGQLSWQHLVRPISEMDFQAMLHNFHQKLMKTRLEVKLKACQAALVLRSKLAENRKKRRNFSKEATAVLNEYYFDNLENPYPEENVKIYLANRTSLTLAQISNWFGNKRIRHRQRMKREMEERHQKEAAANVEDKENCDGRGHQMASPNNEEQ